MHAEFVVRDVGARIRYRGKWRPPTPPVFRVPVARPSGEPRVYVICPDHDKPSGGIRTLYRHVDILNEEGLPAAIVHQRTRFRCTWFDHSTPTMAARDVHLREDDLLVIPEVYGSGVRMLPPGPRKVIFNQGPYLTFRAAGTQSPTLYPYRDEPDVKGAFVVSRDSAAYLRYAFPELRIERIAPGLDSRMYYPADSRPGRLISFMPRRQWDDARQVLGLLMARGIRQRWSVKAIDGLSAGEAADQLRSSAIFMSFSHQEGFGLPSAEAMACGSLVVGFHGGGGREFMRPASCIPVEQGDVVALAHGVEQAIEVYETDYERYDAMRLAASKFVLEEYSTERQRDGVMRAYTAALTWDLMRAPR